MPRITGSGTGVAPVPPEPRGSCLLHRLRELSRPELDRYAGAKLGDWNGDGTDELIVLRSGELRVITLSGEELTRRKLPDHNLSLVQDVSGDQRVELVLSSREGSQIWLSVLDQQLEELKRFTAEGKVYRGKPDSGISAKQIVDLDRDGKVELLATVSTGYGHKPRGLYCFDFESGELEWKVHVGPSPGAVATMDLDGNDALDVVFGSYSPGNGNREKDGTDDHHCYVHAVSSRGERLWTRKLGTHFTGAHPVVASLGREGPLEIVVKVAAGPDYRKEVGKILRLDHRGKYRGQHDGGATIKSFEVADLDGDGQKEVIYTDRLGNVRVLNRDLDVVRRRQVAHTQHESMLQRIEAIVDLDGDGRKEIVLTQSEKEFVSGRNPRSDRGPRNIRHYHNNAAVVLNHELRELSHCVVAKKWDKHPGFDLLTVDADRDGRAEILALTDRALLLRFQPTSRRD